MENQRDLRVQKTYAALFRAFEELLKKKSFEEMTVRELCNIAQTRTATFYKHFTDKYDFFAFMVKELREDYSNNAEIPNSSDSTEYYLTLLYSGLKFLHEKEALIHAIDSDSMMTIIMQTTGNNVRSRLIEHLKKDQAAGCRLAAEPELLAELLIGALNQVSRWWLQDKNQVTIDGLNERLTLFINRMIGKNC